MSTSSFSLYNIPIDPELLEEDARQRSRDNEQCDPEASAEVAAWQIALVPSAVVTSPSSLPASSTGIISAIGAPSSGMVPPANNQGPNTTTTASNSNPGTGQTPAALQVQAPATSQFSTTYFGTVPRNYNNPGLEAPGGACTDPACVCGHTPWPTSGQLIVRRCARICEVCGMSRHDFNRGAGDLRRHVREYHVIRPGQQRLPVPGARGQRANAARLYTRVLSDKEGH